MKLNIKFNFNLLIGFGETLYSKSKSKTKIRRNGLGRYRSKNLDQVHTYKKNGRYVEIYCIVKILVSTVIPKIKDHQES